MKPIILNCNSCKENLKVTEGSVLFYCQQCRKWYEEREGALHEVAFLQADPNKAHRVDFYLPFRAFSLTTVVEGKDKGRCERAQKLADTFQRVYVQAFRTRAAVDYFDWGMEFTKEKVNFSGKTVSDLPNLGHCSRTNADCWPFARAYLIAFIDERVDVTDLEITCSLTSPELIAVPFTVEKNYLVDCALGKRTPKVYLETIPELAETD